MKDIFYITTLDQLRVLSDPLRIKMIWSLSTREKTGKILSEEMKMAPSKIRYHLTELERVGLIELVRTALKNGIQQKFYRTVAANISLEKITLLLNGENVPDLDGLLKENAYCALEELRKNIVQSDLQKNNFLLIPFQVRLTEEEEKKVKGKILEIYNFMQSKSNRTTEAETQSYYASFSFFPLKRE